MATKKTLVLGLGNVIMGDEGVGVHVVRAVEKQELPEGIECLDGGTGGFVLLEPLQPARETSRTAPARAPRSATVIGRKRFASMIYALF